MRRASVCWALFLSLILCLSFAVAQVKYNHTVRITAPGLFDWAEANAYIKCNEGDRISFGAVSTTSTGFKIGIDNPFGASIQQKTSSGGEAIKMEYTIQASGTYKFYLGSGNTGTYAYTLTRDPSGILRRAQDIMLSPGPSGWHPPS